MKPNLLLFGVFLLFGCDDRLRVETAPVEQAESVTVAEVLKPGGVMMDAVTNVIHSSLLAGFDMAKEGVPREAMEDLFRSINGDKASEVRWRDTMAKAARERFVYVYTDGPTNVAPR